jgi:NAD(P)-dependent dehydrogenase (short-subunit alcohol dehydrogenase family)
MTERLATTGRLEGKVALVTGAARGIGEAVARRFDAEGATVYVTDILDDLGRAVAASLERGVYRRLDVRLEEDFVDVLDGLIDGHGHLDVLVNNAGITGFEEGPAQHDPEHADLGAWRGVFQTNADGVFLGCKHAIRVMRARGDGSIVNVGSRSGVVGISGAAAYAASKAAIRNHTKSVALYCAGEGLAIRCNVVQPAAILTPMWEAMLGDGPDREARAAEYTKDTPLRRFGTPAEVAALVAYLASDESAYMTGAELTLDGGMLAGTAAPKS